MTDNWYKAKLRERYDDRAVKEAVLRLLCSLSNDDGDENLDLVEKAAFGKRIACPHDCGSMNLPGAPECWGCERKLP